MVKKEFIGIITKVFKTKNYFVVRSEEFEEYLFKEKKIKKRIRISVTVTTSKDWDGDDLPESGEEVILYNVKKRGQGYRAKAKPSL